MCPKYKMCCIQWCGSGEFFIASACSDSASNFLKLAASASTNLELTRFHFVEVQIGFKSSSISEKIYK